MDKIIFRARLIATGERVYGNYVHLMRFAGCSNEHRIVDIYTGAEYEVDGNTVCQCIGEYDSKGESIFENDILFNPITKKLSKVLFIKAKYIIYSNSFGIEKNPDFNNMVIVGNVFDNPEL